MKSLLVHGMMGLGDNLHQRAIVRDLMRRHDVWLETPWPGLYQDLAADGLKLLSRETALRTQAKNAAREAALFTDTASPVGARILNVGYDLALVKKVGFLPAMAVHCDGSTEALDFRLPIPPAWSVKAARWLRKWKPHKPLLIYRPLVERPEWRGCRTRNPDPRSYARLFEEIAPDFFTVSVADLEPGAEWIVGPEVATNVQCHAGELDIETLAALTAEAVLVFCSPGFALILAQAVGTRVACVFGGHESARHYIASGLYAPYLGIDPTPPCGCFRLDHACNKAIDLDAALPRIRRFATAARLPDPGLRPSIRLPPTPELDLAGLPTRYMPPGDLATIYALVQSVAPRAVIEFGVNEGRTAAALLRNLPSIETYVGVDVTPGYVPKLAVQRNEVPTAPGRLASDDPRFQLVLRKRGSFDLTAADLPKCDAVFIDGDHSRAGVEQDYRLARALVRPGGIIVFHDDHDLGTVDVRDVLDDMHAHGDTAVHVEGSWVAFQKV